MSSPVVYEGTAFELVLDLQLAHVRTAEGQSLAIKARTTPALNCAGVRLGDLVRLKVDPDDRRLWMAELVSAAEVEELMSESAAKLCQWQQQML